MVNINNAVEITNASRTDTGGVKTKERVYEHGEVFTPPWLVSDMLDKLPSRGKKNVWDIPEDGIQKTFLEPACGEGAFLVEILNRKLKHVDKRYGKDQDAWEWHAALTICSIYGIELLEDNSERCITNLYEVFLDHYYKFFLGKKNPAALSAIKFLISRNIMQGDALKFVQRDGNPIVISEFIPIVKGEARLLMRKDFDFRQMAEADIAAPTLFSLVQKEPGLIAEYKPIDWHDIEFALKIESDDEA